MSDSLALVIEDDSDIARLFSLTLQQAGFASEIYADGHSALERLKTLVPRVVLLDLNIPRANGIEILRQMRGDERLAKVPVLVTTANPQMIDEVEELASLVLMKPISFEQLRDLLLRFK